MKSPEIRMYNALKPSLGEEDAQVFIEANNEGVASKIEIMKSDLATKKDMVELREGTKGDILSLKEEMHAFRLEIKEALHAFKVDFTVHTNKIHVECMKAIYITGLIQLIIIIGSVLAIIRASI